MQKDTELCKGDIQEANLRNAGLPQMDPEKFILPAEFKCRFKNQLWLDLEKKKKKKESSEHKHLGICILFLLYIRL